MKKPASFSDFFNHNTFTVNQSWLLYANAVFPKQVSQVQHDETKQAYFAGFVDCFKVLVDFSGELSEDQACALFDRLRNESEQFFNEISGRYKAT